MELATSSPILMPIGTTLVLTCLAAAFSVLLFILILAIFKK
jgi:hypothetical protein